MMVGYNSNSTNIVECIPKNAVGAEIGVWKGDSSELFLKSASPKQLHLVDPWSFSAFSANLARDELDAHLKKYSVLTGSTEPAAFDRFYDLIYKFVVGRFRAYPNVVIHRMTSTEWFANFEEKLDWIYIDGDHTYTGCLNDLNNCLTVMKPNGIIFGDDYGNKVDVKKAVDDFVSAHNFSLRILGQNQFMIGL